MHVGNPETHDGHDLEGFVDHAWSNAIVFERPHGVKKTVIFIPMTLGATKAVELH